MSLQNDTLSNNQRFGSAEPGQTPLAKPHRLPAVQAIQFPA